MVDIRISTSRLTYTQFFIPGMTSEVVDGATPAVLTLRSGTHDFQQMSGQPAEFPFAVTSLGTVDYDAAHDALLGGRGSATLLIRGFPVTLDTAHLSHSLVPTVFGAHVLPPGEYDLTLVSGRGYRFHPASGITADLSLTVQPDGTSCVDPPGGFTQLDGCTVTFTGYRVASRLMLDTAGSSGQRNDFGGSTRISSIY